MDTKQDYKQIINNAIIAVITAAITGSVTSLVYQNHGLKQQRLIDVVVALVALILSFYLLMLRRRSTWDVLFDDKRNIVQEIKQSWLVSSSSSRNPISLDKAFPVTTTVTNWKNERFDIPESDLLVRFDYRMSIECDQNSGQAFFVRRVKQLVDEYEADEKRHVPIVLSADTWFKPADLINFDVNGSSKSGQNTTIQDGFRDWVIRQLKSHYGISPERSHLLLQRHELVYCIEGIERVGRYHDVASALSTPDGKGDHTATIQSLFQQMIREYDTDNNFSTPIIIMSTKDPQTADWSSTLSEGYCKIDVNYPSEVALQKWLVDSGEGLVSLKNYIEHKGLTNLYHPEFRSTLEMIAARCIETDPSAVIRDKSDISDIRHDAYVKHFKDMLKNTDARWSKKSKYRERQYVRALITEGSLAHIIKAAQKAIQWFDVDAVFRFDEIQPSTSTNKDTLGIYQTRLMLLLMAFIALSAGLPSAIGIWYGWFSRSHSLHGLLAGLGTFMSILLGGVIAGYGYTRNLNQEVAGMHHVETGPSNWFHHNRLRLGSSLAAHVQMIKRSAWIGFGFGLGRGITVALAATTYSYSTPYIGGLVQGLYSIIAASLIFFSYFCFLNDDPLIIQIKEKKEGVAPIRATIAVIISVAVALGVWKAGSNGGWERGVAFGSVLLAFNYAFFVRKNSVSPRRIKPNDAIKEAFRTSRNLSLSLALFAALVFSVTYWFGYHNPKEGVEVFFEAMSFLLTFFFLDGLSLMKNVALRYALEATGQFPRHFDMILEFSTDMGLLISVGGGYKYPNDDIKEFIIRFDDHLKKLKA